MKKDINIFDKIEDIEEYIGDKNRKYDTVIEIAKTDNPDIKTLSLKSGSWDGKEPWFIIDENQKLHTMISIDSIHKLIENFKKLQQDNFDLKLEKTILQHVPIDFQDVWTVAMDEIKKLADKNNHAKSLNIDLEKLLRKIKKEHPNLFLNLKDLFMGQNMPTNT
ncbi:MAG: DUF2603 domain-containing protein [Sulfurospirillaceae bacterium]|nr:DUF2603 domain-containing protein [Sulfurospirillaceae bacterium]